MVAIHLLKFKQMGGYDTTTHWGIFLSNTRSSIGDCTLPAIGTLFHAQGDCLACLGSCSGRISSQTEFQQHDNFCPSNSPTLISWHRLSNTDVDNVTVAESCDLVTQDRNWNLLTSNCQVWVLQVMDDLVEKGHVAGTVVEEMSRNGYSTITQRAVDSTTKSLGFCWI
jgi:Family of unknown function (DUF6540)